MVRSWLIDDEIKKIGELMRFKVGYYGNNIIY